MVSSTSQSINLSDLSANALAEMGGILAETERLLNDAYQPYRVIVSKLGFSSGFNCHFHVLPVHAWLMDEIIRHLKYSAEPDGNDVMLYVNREYCENQPIEKAQSVSSAEMERLKQFIVLSRE